MDIHKPKPIRNWRELLTEIGVIVLSVCIALAAEQAVENLHNRSRAAEARANIRTEIARNLGYMDVRQTTETCMEKRLDEVDGLIAASAAGKLPQDALWIGQPRSFVMQDARYKAAVQSGAVSLFDDKEQAVYADLYGQYERYNRAVGEEEQDWANLRTLEKHPPASPTLDWQLCSALQMARTHRFTINLRRQVTLKIAAGIGVTPTPEGQSKWNSACVPLHTPRDEALKRSAVGDYNAPIP